MNYDFTGYATRNDTRCSDGRTIRQNAFIENDGTRVPLVWQHCHNSPTNVIGHADLENREDGVYAYGKFNSTETGKIAKDLVKHGDITALSIYANHLIEKDGNVMHGSIKEVSLVLCGANPGAFIDNVAIMHSDGNHTICDSEAVIFNDSELVICHSDEDSEDNNQNDSKDDEKTEKKTKSNKEGKDDMAENKSKTVDENDETIGDIYNSLNSEQKKVVSYLVGKALANDVEHSDYNDEELYHEDKEDKEDEDSTNDKTVGDVFETLTEKQKNVVYYLIAKAIDARKSEKKNTSEEDVKHSDDENYNGGYTDMKYNVFENYETETEMMHADFEDIKADAKRCGSFRDAYLAHAGENAAISSFSDGSREGTPRGGFRNVDYLFPDAQLVNKKIDILRNDPTDWVTKVMNGVHKTPFSRIKTIYADVTADEARARGYVTGNQKVSEVVKLLHRTTAPTTIYKLQKMDRDDVVDITDFDVIAWLKAEMRIMLDEEIARAILIGATKTNGVDEINTQCVRPIMTDADTYAVKAHFTTDSDVYEEFIDAATLAMGEYQGTGVPSLYCAPDFAIRLTMIKDGDGKRIYKNLAEVASAIGVKEIIAVPYMKPGYKNAEGEDSMKVADGLARGIIVNLSDYTVGADKGGAVNMFDDFDIDYNQQKYLIETRISGALTKAKSALVVVEDGYDFD